MSATADVIKFAQKFKEEKQQLNVLVNNAGCMVHQVKLLGPLKLETNFATNTVGTYCLTEELIPLLKKSEKPRVVSCSSFFNKFEIARTSFNLTLSGVKKIFYFYFI